MDVIQAQSQEDACHLLDLSDDLLLVMTKMLSISNRARLSSLHSRLHDVVKRSWLQVKVFPSTRVGFTFPADDKKGTLLWIEDYFKTVLDCKNLRILRLPNSLRDAKKTRDSWHDRGWQLGSSCCFLQKIVGKHNHIDFILGFTEALEMSGRTCYLTEVSIHEMSTEEDIYSLERIVKLSPELKTIRILIVSMESLCRLHEFLRLVTAMPLLQKLQTIATKMHKFIIPKSLETSMSLIKSPVINA